MQSYVELTKNPNQTLTIKFRKGCKTEGKRELKEALKRGSVEAWVELLEYQLCNGWESFRDDTFALCSNPFVISDDISQDDQGNYAHIGRVFYYSPFMVRCPVEELIREGQITLSSTV